MKRIAVLISDGFEELETLSVIDCFRRVSQEAILVSADNLDSHNSSHNTKISVDKKLSEINSDVLDAVIIPGGIPGATNLRDNKKVIEFVKEMHSKNKLIGAICAGPIVLAKADIINGKNITSYPNFDEPIIKAGANYSEETICCDDNFITSRGPALAIPFAIKLVEKMVGKEEAKELYNSMLLPFLKDSLDIIKPKDCNCNCN